ncbi:hypothetical protein DPMN_151937 [Dreissena polymorpha]|uniref:Uncharacterized protein n=1 Tax=Dreissena polymorpha TaxID=45954 RepID=A0A9D4FGA9_DREPO|nr:hypothetical protein DPMN_151937 [Dreissena polymorpha]
MSVYLALSREAVKIGMFTVRTINVTLRVLIRRTSPPFGDHVFQETGTIELIQDIIDATALAETNHLTKFHDDRTINVASRVLTRKNVPHPGGNVFQPTGTIFKLVQDIIRTNLRTNLKRKNVSPPGGNVFFKPTETIFELVHDIIGTNLLTEFHEDRTVNVASRVLTGHMLKSHNARRTTDKRRSQKLTMSTLRSWVPHTGTLIDIRYTWRLEYHRSLGCAVVIVVDCVAVDNVVGATGALVVVVGFDSTTIPRN